LAAFEVELVQRRCDTFGEAGEATAQSVLGRKLGASLGERILLLAQPLAAGGERGGASGELVEVQ
jgi:hypothetical protein